MTACPNHAHITDAQLLAMTEADSAVCMWLWERWLILRVKPAR